MKRRELDIIKIYANISFVVILFPSTISAQNVSNAKINAYTQKRLVEISKENRKDVQEQLSPYDAKNKNVALNPMMPHCRDVSRTTTLDMAHYRFLYAFNATDLTKSSTFDDLQRLEVGQKYLKYYSAYAYQADSCETAATEEINRLMHTNYKVEGGNVAIELPMRGKHQGWSRYLFSEFFFDLKAKQLTEYCRMPGSVEEYNSFYSETIPTQNWFIGSETQDILGYQCQKATCKFRGRNYTAWFTTEIPLCYGPWKFGGLPGLILKVYDEKKEFVFHCVGIERPKSAIRIFKLNNYKTYSSTTRTNLDKLLKRICENYYQVSGLTNAVAKRLKPYNPMELE